jgi:hypothetical protein
VNLPLSRILYALLSAYLCISLAGCNLPQTAFQGGGGEPELRVLSLPTPTSQAYESSIADEEAGNILYHEDFEGDEPPDILIENFDYSSGQAQLVSQEQFLWEVSTDPWMPITGHSHPTALITAPLNTYPDYAYGYVLTPPIDLTQASQAMLRLTLYFDIEDHFDGLLILSSIDQGVTWQQLMPEQGYTGSVYIFDNDPGYTGSINAWWPITVDLAQLTGNMILIAFEFGSDDSVNYAGAAIDDIIVSASAPSDSDSSAPDLPPGFIPPVRQPSQPNTVEGPDVRWATTGSITNCREGTNQSFQVLTTLDSGQAVPIKAVNPNRSWLFVFDLEDQISCWAWAGLMDAPENLDGLPVLPDELPPGDERGNQPGNGGEVPPICTDTLPAPECVAAGGTPQTSAWPPCICP